MTRYYCPDCRTELALCPSCSTLSCRCTSRIEASLKQHWNSEHRAIIKADGRGVCTPVLGKEAIAV